MPEINPALVPSITPGNLFVRFTTDDTLNIRWLTPLDPVLFEALNRPLVDITLRQLIIAKALDNIELQLGHLTLFPFLVPPKLRVGSGDIELPQAWIWDMHVSMPAKWEYIRLAHIKRISGVNNGGTGTQVTGRLRLVFSGQVQGSGTEVYLFYADYQIDSNLNFQYVRILPVTATEEANPIDPSEAQTVDGFIIFRTLNAEDPTINPFFQAVAPPISGTVSSDGLYAVPTVYDLDNTPAADVEIFLAATLSHGSGVVVASAFNAIPALDSDFATWLKSSNYPFRIGNSRTSVEGILIPQGLFNEFSVVCPAADAASNDPSLNNSPVWLSRIQRVDSLATQLLFVLATNTINDDGSVEEAVDFAAFTLSRTMTPGTVVAIAPLTNLLQQDGTDQADFIEGFGAGHVVLGSLWGSTTQDIENFFDSFLTLVSTDTATFNQSTARLSSFSTARSSRYIPTKGQWDALRGTTGVGRFTVPINPSDSNRYVTESDQGLGQAIDFRTKPGFTENPDIDPIGYTGSLLHRIVWLEVDASQPNHDYATDILPRLTCLLGRAPIFGDEWYDGTVFKKYNGDTWITI
jgi:hypothetical protein